MTRPWNSAVSIVGRMKTQKRIFIIYRQEQSTVRLTRVAVRGTARISACVVYIHIHIYIYIYTFADRSERDRISLSLLIQILGKWISLALSFSFSPVLTAIVSLSRGKRNPLKASATVKLDQSPAWVHFTGAFVNRPSPLPPVSWILFLIQFTRVFLLDFPHCCVRNTNFPEIGAACYVFICHASCRVSVNYFWIISYFHPSENIDVMPIKKKHRIY